MDYSSLSRQLLRGLRGHRSQVAVARRLGYRSNVIYFWESGRRTPPVHEVMRMARLLGIDVEAAVARFYRSPPKWLEQVDLTTRAGMARILAEHRGGARFHEIAEKLGKSRYSVSRWFKGEVEVRLSDYLHALDVVSLRVVDFVAALVDPTAIPAIQDRWERLQARRNAAFELPMIQAVLRVFELESYRELPCHSPGFIAKTIGISADEEERCINLLLRTGQLKLSGGRLVAGAGITVDTRLKADASARLKEHWAEVGLARLKSGGEGAFAYNVFGVSEEDAKRLIALQNEHFHKLRAIVAASEPTERVFATNLQLFPLDRP